MASLVAIGCLDETTATAAAEEAQRLTADLIIQPDAIAAISRDKEGKFHGTTNHHAVSGGASYGMFWGLLFGMLFFIPFFGMALGAGLGALMGKLTKSGIDKAFQDHVRDLLPARHVRAVPGRGEDHTGQGRRGSALVPLRLVHAG
jgi:uncharacterized membrane protein